MTHYNKVYGQWAGNPRGRPPNLSRCCEEVYSNGSMISSQCQKPNGHGPDGAYCAQHDPAAVAARREASREKYEMRAYEERLRRMGPALPLIRAIAAGHNDPRQAAIEWLEKYEPKPPAVTPPPPPPVRK